MEYTLAYLLRHPVGSVDVTRLLSASFTLYRLHTQVLEETELLLRHNSYLSPPSENFCRYF